MRILFICDHLGYSEGGWNGCMTYFRNVLLQLQQEGHTVALCVLRGEHQAQDALRAVGIPVTSLDAARASPVTLLYLMRKILREDLEIIHSAQRESSWHARVLGFLLGRPSVVHIVDSQPVPLVQRIIDRAMPQPHVALCVSRAIRSFASDAYGIAPERVRVLHNALDVERIKPRVFDARDRLRRAWDVAADAPVVVSTSRFTAEKRLDALIRMIPEVLEKEPRARFILAGSGPDLEACQQLAERLGVMAAARFLGHRDDIPDVLAASDVAVMLCPREAFGYSALEAMASNLPVVAFKGTGLAEVVTDGVSGLLAPSSDDARFLANLLRLVSDEALRKALGARARIDARRFDVRFHTEALCRIYRHLVQPLRQRSRAH